jgi:ornithine carbamoyltransferase
MAVNLKGRSLLTLKHYSREEILFLLDLSDKVKAQRRNGEIHQRFRGKTLAMLFEKLSTRTRCAFETAFGEEGGHPVFLSSNDIHLGVKETVEDTARVLGRMFDAIEYRGFDQAVVETLATYSDVPVYNGLTDLYHPTQVLADLQTLREATGELAGRSITYVGDGRNNVARSLMIGCAKIGANFSVAAPDSLQPDNETVLEAKRYAEESGSVISISADPARVLPNSDAVYTDVWVSMGEEAKSSERVALLIPYRVTTDLMALTGNPQTVFLHCLPAVRGNEVTSDVMDGRQSRIWDQAENRKHTIKAMMLATLLPASEL